MKKVLLYSGGLDSWLISKVWKPDLRLYVDMGTEYSECELERLPSDVKVVKLPLAGYSLENSIIPLRNLYLFSIAANETGFDDVEICLGALSGDRINDKNLTFAAKLNDLFDYLYQPQVSQPGRIVRAVMPYKEYSKTELLQEYLDNGGDIETAWNESFSCYHPVNDKPCLDCKACFRKVVPFILCGKTFSDAEKNKIKTYVKNHVLTDMENFTKDKGKEGKDCLVALGIIREWRNVLHADNFYDIGRAST